MQAYKAYKASLAGNAPNTKWNANARLYEGAECLAMIVFVTGLATDSGLTFRDDEVGDIDEDGALEFHDGWGRPIAFIRWPAGFESQLQTRNSLQQPDPFDPHIVSQAVAYPSGTQRDYSVIPLIYSAGPDEAGNDPFGGASGFGIRTGVPDAGWIRTVLDAPGNQLTLRLVSSGAVAGETDPLNSDAVIDNITNHDLITK
jgi:hypothetical protein